MSARSSMLVLACLTLIAGGCGDSDEETSSDNQTRSEQSLASGALQKHGASEEPSEPPSETETTTNTGISPFNGQADAWQGIDPIWEEAGAAGKGEFPGMIDLKQVYIKSDAETLSLFLWTMPSVAANFKEHGTSGELCDLYLDTDNDPATGCRGVKGFDYGSIDGYEYRLWVPLGVHSGPSGTKPFVSYSLMIPDEDGTFNLFDSTLEAQSTDQDAPIRHGTDGIELSIPLEQLDIQLGATIRLLLKESVDPFAKERYSEGTYTVR